MKRWLTADEIAALALPGLPATKAGVHNLAEREQWIARRDDKGEALARLRRGRGGGVEYRLDLLPADSLSVYAARHIGAADIPATDIEAAASEEKAAQLTAAAAEARDARLAIIAAAKTFARNARLSDAIADAGFCRLYNSGKIEVDAWIKQRLPQVSPRSLRRWRDAAKNGRASALGVDPGANRRGKSGLETAFNGGLKTFCLALVAKQPHLSADHVYTIASDRFEGHAMPSLRSFQRHLCKWKDEHAVALTQITNPDAFKSRYRASARGSHPVSRLNQLWMIDASPADVLLNDGRSSIYVAVDVFSRRIVITVTKTPRASAVGLLLRKAIIAWGVPELVKTDNGSDFVARATKRLFLALGIETETAAPFSPEQKGHVERAIGTLQRDLMPLLPGFIGHSVTDRKAIESRKAFAQRLGEPDGKVFCADMDAAELQAFCDQWADQRYAHRAHDGLQGRTPFEAAAAFPGAVRRIEDPHALDMLLAPVSGKDGVRRVGKSGIRIDGAFYLTPTVLPGADVLVRMDGADLGKAFLFTPDGAEYLGEAVCPELAGIDPIAAIAATRAEQKRILDEGTAELRAQMKQIKPRDMAQAVMRQSAKNAGRLVEFPKRSETHTTPQIEAAAEAMGKGAPKRPQARPVSDDEMRALEADISADAPARASEGKVTKLVVPESKETRFRRALALEARIKSGESIGTDEALWLGGYQAGAEYRAMKTVYEDFGEAALR